MTKQQLDPQAQHLIESRQEFAAGLKVTSEIMNALHEEMKTFRVFLDAALSRVQENFDDSQLAAAGRLVEAQERFATTAENICDVAEALNTRVKHYDDIFAGQMETIAAHVEQSKLILEMFPKLFSAFADVNLSVKENTEKLDRVIAKMESYFGSGTGLEYDN